jgi:hypothetical protein
MVLLAPLRGALLALCSLCARSIAAQLVEIAASRAIVVASPTDAAQR